MKKGEMPSGLLLEPVRIPLRWLRAVLRALPRVFGGGFTRCQVRDLSIELLVTSEIERYRAESYETKEPDTLDWIDRELKEGDVLFDIGANVGVYSLYAAKRVPGSIVYAFEPEAQNFAHLCRNIHRNSLKNVLPACVPLSDKESFARLHVTEMEAGTAFHSLHAPSNQRIGGPRSVLEQGMLSSSLDRLTEGLGLPAPSLIKLDVDGHEDAIIAGAKSLLKSGKVRGVLVELNGESKIPEVLAACGFELVSKGPGVKTGTGETSRNCIFRRA